MEKPGVQLLRLAVKILGTVVVISLFVLLLGYFLGWQEAVKFSNGFFWAGVILIVLGALSVTGGFAQRADFKMMYAETAGQANIAERNQRWAADITQRYGYMIFMLVTGLFLIGISIAIGQLLIV